MTSQTSLVRLDREHQREVLFRDLAARDNRARREAEAEGSPAERERRLTLLFLLPPTQASDVAVRRDSAFYLARLRTAGARDVLIRALGDPDPDRAEIAAAALGWSDDPLATQELAVRLDEDADPAVRRLAALGLTLAAPNVGAAAALTQAAKNERDLDVRLRALDGLAHCDLASDPAARKVLIELLNSDTEDLALRRGVIRTLRAHHTLTRRLPVELQDALRRLLSATQGPLLIDGIGLLGQVATDPAPLEDAQLKSSNPEIRAALQAALVSVRNRIAPR
ncbi:MAG: HEAT repeat domain-containing protein [Planctomycetes bacterium]|nr:HEAT repeat domain-containing protein [Planctomycetota bacterium]